MAEHFQGGKRIGSKDRKSKKYFTLQWHVTAKCPNACAHCYLKNESKEYKSEIRNELSFEDCIKVIDDFYSMTKSWNVGARINFTGGDPLLKEGIFDLMKYANSKGIAIGILGNGEYLNEDTVFRLKEAGVLDYQVSLDGMEETHDKLRYRGSFKETLRGIKLLNQAGIISVVMFTLSRKNMDDLIPLINLVAEENVSIFDFSRLVPIGKGVQFKKDLINPYEYRELLVKVFEEHQRLEQYGCKTIFGRKEHLWRLLYQELGLFHPLPQNREIIFRGCAIGIHLIVVGADGTVYPCRRLPIKIGKVPNQSLRSIFINSPTLNEMRKVEKMEKCGRCELLQYCRGCPAVAWSVNGSFFAPDPQCWKEV